MSTVLFFLMPKSVTAGWCTMSQCFSCQKDRGMQKPPRSSGEGMKVETESKDPAAVRGQRKGTQRPNDP